MRNPQNSIGNYVSVFSLKKLATENIAIGRCCDQSGEATQHRDVHILGSCGQLKLKLPSYDARVLLMVSFLIIVD